jgi:hypothetical protein
MVEASRHLEVNFGPGETPRKFEVVEVEFNVFMLTTKETIFELVDTLTDWLHKNPMVSENRYKQMVRTRRRLKSSISTEFRDLSISDINHRVSPPEQGNLTQTLPERVQLTSNFNPKTKGNPERLRKGPKYTNLKHSMQRQPIDRSLDGSLDSVDMQAINYAKGISQSLVVAERQKDKIFKMSPARKKFAFTTNDLKKHPVKVSRLQSGHRGSMQESVDSLNITNISEKKLGLGEIENKSVDLCDRYPRNKGGADFHSAVVDTITESKEELCTSSYYNMGDLEREARSRSGSKGKGQAEGGGGKTVGNFDFDRFFGFLRIRAFCQMNSKHLLGKPGDIYKKKNSPITVDYNLTPSSQRNDIQEKKFDFEDDCKDSSREMLKIDS